MNRTDLVLAVLAASSGAPWSPVQVQKMFFLLDQKVGQELGGPHWDFRAYDYGPFDSAVYGEIERIQADGLASIEGGEFSRTRRFALSPAGQERGESLLEGFAPALRDYVCELASWVRGLSFQALVSAVYRDYPEMRVNSIFRD